VNYDNSLVVTITVTCNLWAPSSGDHYLHVAPSPGRHITSLSINLKFYHFYHPHFNSQLTSSTLALWFKTFFNEGCYWEGIMAFLPSPLSGAICCSWLHRLESPGRHSPTSLRC